MHHARTHSATFAKDLHSGHDTLHDHGFIWVDFPLGDDTGNTDDHSDPTPKRVFFCDC